MATRSVWLDEEVVNGHFDQNSPKNRDIDKFGKQPYINRFLLCLNSLVVYCPLQESLAESVNHQARECRHIWKTLGLSSTH